MGSWHCTHDFCASRPSAGNMHGFCLLVHFIQTDGILSMSEKLKGHNAALSLSRLESFDADGIGLQPCVSLRHAAWSAGRILHIVPARLLYPGVFPAASPVAAPKESVPGPEGTAAAQQQNVLSPEGQQQPPAAPANASPLSRLRPSPVETVESPDEALSTAPFSPHGMDRGDLDEELGDSRMSGLSPDAGPADESSQSSNDKPQRIKGHRRNLSATQYEFAPAEFDGSVMILRRLYPSDDEAEGEAVPVEVPLTAREQFLVLDAVPQVGS